MNIFSKHILCRYEKYYATPGMITKSIFISTQDQLWGKERTPGILLIA